MSLKWLLHYITCHLADALIQSDLQLLRLSRRHFPLEQCGVKGLAQGPNSCADLIVAAPGIEPPTLRVQRAGEQRAVCVGAVLWAGRRAGEEGLPVQAQPPQTVLRSLRHRLRLQRGQALHPAQDEQSKCPFLIVLPSPWHTLSDHFIRYTFFHEVTFTFLSACTSLAILLRPLSLTLTFFSFFTPLVTAVHEYPRRSRVPQSKSLKSHYFPKRFERNLLTMNACILHWFAATWLAD